MENHSKSTILIGTVVFLIAGAWVSAQQAVDPLVLNQERQLKEDAEKQAQGICDSILGKDKSSVLVSVELGLESTKKGGTALNRKLESKSGLGDENYILPWVPAPKSVTKEETPKDASVNTQAAQQSVVDVKTVLSRFDITVVHDDKLPEGRVELTKETLKSAFARYKSILKIYFRPTSFLGDDGFNPKETVTKNLWDSLTIKNFILLFLLLLAFWLLKFFFGPLARFMSDYIQSMKDQARSKVEMESQADNETEADSESDENFDGESTGEGGDLSPEEIAELEAQEALMEQKLEPFTYVTDENVKQLAYLLHHEEPWIVALVISYLTPDHAYKVMEALPADLQAKVALETAMYRQTSEDQVRQINEDIKEKIDFVVGGLEKLVGILESSDRFSRENILEYLKNEKPGLYEKVRERVLLFEDIVKFPKVAMQTLVRELKTEELGRALKGTSPELQQVFFDNMSQGAVTLLKEEIDFGRPLTPDQIEEERRKILDVIKKMEEEGKISFREKGTGSALTGDEVASVGPEINADVQPNPEEAVNEYNHAMAAVEQGQTDEAIQHFELSVKMDPNLVAAHQGLANAYYEQNRYEEALASYEAVLSLEPNEELQEWVGQLRASLKTAA